MSCTKCKRKKCCCSTSDSSSANSSTSQSVKEVETLTNFLKGHPIIMIDDPSDVVLFNFITGKGSGIWEEWALCDGQIHGTIGTPNLIDRFIVGAGGAYDVADTGGQDTVALTIAELPIHSHSVTDPGHTHTVTDPGHGHTVTDPQHTHTITDTGHSHGGSSSSDGAHTHTVNDDDIAQNSLLGHNTGNAAEEFGFGTISMSIAGDHNHTITVTNNPTGVTVNNAATGVSVNNNVTGVTADTAVTGVTAANTGNGDAHENRPPFYALIFIKKVA